jgi:hypothetical protein
MSVATFDAGGYRYIEGMFQYSGGSAAQPGFEIVRARFARPLALQEGFRAIEAHLKAAERPLTSFCACELRSPKPFTEPGFLEFNRAYVQTLERWGLYKDGRNPVARTNVCPAYDAPAEPAFHAFSYTVRARSARGSFIVAGSGEAPEGKGNYRDHVIRPNDVSREGLREKMRFVMAEMESRLKALGFAWQDAGSTQVYTVCDVGALVEREIFAKGAAPGGLSWHFCRPPVAGLEYEMDVRGAAHEFTLLD